MVLRLLTARTLAALMSLSVVLVAGCGIEPTPGVMAGTYQDLTLGLWLNAEPVYERAVEYDADGEPQGISETWATPTVPVECVNGSVLSGRLEGWNFVVIEDSETEATFRLGDVEFVLPALGPQFASYATYGGEVEIDGRSVLVTADILIDSVWVSEHESSERATVVIELRQTYGVDCVEEGFVEGSKSNGSEYLLIRT